MKVSRSSPRAARIRSRSRAVVDGADGGEDGPAVPLALVGEFPVVAEQGLSGRGGGRDRVDGWPRGSRVRMAGPGGGADDRAAAPDPPGVERDDVEAVEHLGREHRHFVGQIVDARGPGSAGVDDQGPDPLGGHLGRMPGHRDLQGGAALMVVVERDGHRAALQVAARRPLDRHDRQRWLGGRHRDQGALVTGHARLRSDPGPGRHRVVGAAGDEGDHRDGRGQAADGPGTPRVGRRTGRAPGQSGIRCDRGALGVRPRRLLRRPRRHRCGGGRCPSPRPPARPRP